MTNREVEPLCYRLIGDGVIPNNPHCALLVYPQVVDASVADMATHFEQLFAANQWGSSWRGGVFPFHHFHSTAHEVLGIYRGWVQVQMGGSQGAVVRAAAGDVVVVPAGVGHKKIDEGDDFGCVGAYPRGQEPDLCQGEEGYARCISNIDNVALPTHDPVYGLQGPLAKLWQVDK